MKILNVVGARPNFMKISPILRETRRYPDIETFLVNTGQHYNQNMVRVFFEILKLPKPGLDLKVGSGTHAWQTANIMLRFEPILNQFKPDLIILVGDVNSTLACALVAAKLSIPIAHVESGLRSFDRTMPEEINRQLTDALSDFLFTHCQDANENLLKEGISEDRIFFTGNVMVDSLIDHLCLAQKSKIRKKLGLEGISYALVTLHRPSNVDDFKILSSLVGTFNHIGTLIPVIFPAHPRTLKRLKHFGLLECLNEGIIHVLNPLGYLDFLHLMNHAKVVLTDSGGIQEETTVLGVPCLTLLSNTERPVTIREGANVLVGNDRSVIMNEIKKIISGDIKIRRIPKMWDGLAAQRILAVIANHFNLSINES